MTSNTRRSEASWLLMAKRARIAAERLEREFGQDLARLERAVRRTAKGERSAAQDYFAAWQSLATGILKLVRAKRPDLIVLSKSGELLVVDVKGDPPEVTADLFAAAAPAAPFSPWVGMVGLSKGIGLRLLAEVRATIPGAVPLVPKSGMCPHWTNPDAMRTALQLLRRAAAENTLARPRTPLARLTELFDLDRTELAKLFGVTRQAVEQWERRGVPAERQEKLMTVLSIGELLTRKLRPGILPGVARKAADAYGGRTMLEMIAEDDHAKLLESVRASFDWAATA